MKPWLTPVRSLYSFITLASPFLQMSVNLSAPALPMQLKRVDCEDHQNTHTLKCKRRRLSQPPSPGLAPCRRPQTHKTDHTSPEKPCLSSIGPYILLEATEGTQTYRAVHRTTEQEYTCKVSSLSSNMIFGISVSIVDHLTLVNKSDRIS